MNEKKWDKYRNVSEEEKNKKREYGIKKIQNINKIIVRQKSLKIIMNKKVF